MKQILLISEVAVWAKTKKREKKNRKKTSSSNHASHNRSGARDSSGDAPPFASSTMKTVATMREEAFLLASSVADSNAASANAAAASEANSAGGTNMFGAFFGEQDHTDLSDQLVKWEEPSATEKEVGWRRRMEFVMDLSQNTDDCLLCFLFFIANAGSFGCRNY